jgi:glucose dehydrogenase
MLVLRYAGLVALTLWVGGLLVVGGIAAPSIFDVLAARQVANARLVAGAIFGEILRRFHVMSFACGAVLLSTLVMRGVMGPRPIMFAARVGIAFLMLAAAAYSGLIVAPRIALMQSTATVAPSSLPENDPRRVEFGRLHAISTGIQLVPLLGGLFLLFRELKD